METAEWRKKQLNLKNALWAGVRLTSAEANKLVGTTDSRKMISRLRRAGFPISDVWEKINGRRFKIYFYIQTN